MEETNSNINDSAIQLFGKKIRLRLGEESPPLLKKEVLEGEERPNEDCPSGEVPKATQEDEIPPSSGAEASSGTETLTDNNVNPKTDSIDEESVKLRNSKAEKEQNDATNSQEKSLKKPDKILPCPRCNSMDTKFCYYNNYNISQPRHFCKACQRYWTAGGTMRNVPVGAGRRKNKSSALNYRNLKISEALQAAGVDFPNGAHHPSLKINGGVLSFGLDAPIRDSMASVMNLADKNVLNGTPNGFHGFQEKHNPGPCKVGDIGEDCLSTVTACSPMEEAVSNYPQELRGINGFASPIPCIPSVPWAPYPWNSPIVSLPAFCQAGYPMPFYPAAYWNCGMAGAWNIPLQSPQSSSSSNLKDKSSSPNSNTLGKHSRDTDALIPEYSEIEEPTKQKIARVLVPKILRIDDPNDAAKSSIWTTLGIKTESSCREGLFKALQSKGDGKSCVAETSPVLRANPAALSRSIEFRESS